MKFYTHHIRDFNNATRHLTRTERSVYRDMIELYFDSEMPLPLDVAQLCKRVLARDEAEKAAVLALLDEFFTETAEGWRSQRCDEEIAAAVIKIGEAERKRENERDRQDRHRERRKGLFAQLRDFDEIPPYETSTEQLQIRLNTHLSRVTERRQDAPATANHIPLPLSHIPKEEQHSADAPAGDADPDHPGVKPKRFSPQAALAALGVEKQQADDFLVIRKAKKAPLTMTALEGIKAEAEKAGLSVAGAVAICCVRGWQGFKASWVTEDARGGATRSSGKPSINDIGVKPGADDDIFNQMRKTL